MDVCTYGHRDLQTKSAQRVKMCFIYILESICPRFDFANGLNSLALFFGQKQIYSSPI